jgi:hypothetical protein
VSHHRKVLVNRLKPVIEKRLKEKSELGDKYKPYVSKIGILFFFEYYFYINLLIYLVVNSLG